MLEQQAFIVKRSLIYGKPAKASLRGAAAAAPVHCRAKWIGVPGWRCSRGGFTWAFRFLASKSLERLAKVLNKLSTKSLI
ncbi:hypothetical protein Mpe_A0009 [Methylibium petroleiphilum PM1]|uniref:Uncharacterized protein n=1 Tax=Methylibium petroleiphilum (strain ATCC BAA-1232 / LMG 22953 / PM1) TaxID=420662 RepID=A2SBN2_METPP|nr:hypothetical protein Mpe_A0009 [Methylibium petroleiphilum PM1]